MRVISPMEEWALVAPMIPPARRAAAGCQHARGHQRPSLPAVDWLPVAGAAQGFAAEEHGAPLFQAVGLGRHAGAHPLCALCGGREQAGREASPSAAIIDSQSAKTAQKGGASMDPQGYDAGKKVTGRKRHLVDTLGLLLSVAVHPADIHDRDGVAFVLRNACIDANTFRKSALVAAVSAFTRTASTRGASASRQPAKGWPPTHQR
jgi:putative transposase